MCVTWKKKFIVFILALDIILHYKAKMIKNNRKIVLFSYGLPIFDPQDKIRKKLNKSNYKLIKGDSFNQVGVEIWEK